MTIALVVAVAENGVIGRAGGLPWRLSTDLKRFKSITLGRPVIMGRKTWESLGRPLPGRANIVITRDAGFKTDGAEVATSLENAIAIASQGPDEGPIYIIGGAEIYRVALDHADLLHVTHVEAQVEGDAFFPAINPDYWKVVHSEHIPAGEKDDFPSRYVIYESLKQA